MKGWGVRGGQSELGGKTWQRRIDKYLQQTWSEPFQTKPLVRWAGGGGGNKYEHQSTFHLTASSAPYPEVTVLDDGEHAGYVILSEGRVG